MAKSDPKPLVVTKRSFINNRIVEAGQVATPVGKPGSNFKDEAPSAKEVREAPTTREVAGTNGKPPNGPPATPANPVPTPAEPLA